MAVFESTPAKGFPAPPRGFVVTHLLIVADQDRSRAFYRDVLGEIAIRCTVDGHFSVGHDAGRHVAARDEPRVDGREAA